MEGIVVPGSKSTKYKKERDLIGLSGDQVYCISEIFSCFLDFLKTLRPLILYSSLF